LYKTDCQDIEGTIKMSNFKPLFFYSTNFMMNAGSDTAQMKAIDWLTMQTVKKYYNWWWKFWL
jgi:hypothetical protein